MTTARILKSRERVVDAIRSFFKSEGFCEVETPSLVPCPGLEPHLDPFEVAARGGAVGYLPTSPEYAMKKLLAAGSGDIFQICKAFRDEPPSDFHLSEFTMLEWYRVGERMCAFVARAACGDAPVVWRGATLDFATPCERISVRDAFHTHAGLDLTFAEPLDELRRLAETADGVGACDDDTWDDVFFKVFLRHVEPKLGLGRPTILFDYPARMAALSRIKADDPLVCERFELYAGGVELANAFGELTDAAEQRGRFEADNAERRRLGKPELPIDEEFLAALESGLPECSGIALGVDRLIMLLTDTPDIRRVVPLPPRV